MPLPKNARDTWPREIPTLNEQLVDLCAEVERLKDQRQAFLHLRKREQMQLQEQWNQIQQSIEDNIEAEASAQQSRYRAIRGYLNEFTRQVLDRGVLLRTYLNQEGNIEFAAEYLGTDGKPSGEDQGKLYIRFLYHDGLLEGLGDRKKLNLITTIRRFAVFGIQQIVTVIDSGLPTDETGNRIAFQNDEIVLTLHDEDDIGRLFRMPPW